MDVGRLGAAVRQRRRALGWSQGRLAEAAGVSRPWISEFESGKRSVEIGLAFAVLDALGLRINLIASTAGRSDAPPGVAAGRRTVPKAGSSAGARSDPGPVASAEETTRETVRPAITKGGKSIAAARARAAFNFNTAPSRSAAKRKPK